MQSVSLDTADYNHAKVLESGLRRFMIVIVFPPAVLSPLLSSSQPLQLRPYQTNLLVIILFISKKWVGRAGFFFCSSFFLNWYECGSEDKDFIYFRMCI